MKLAVIPARGGSKRIPRKNIKLFAGKPMIAYAIELALHSGIFDAVIVSTDDEEIARISIQLGALVPFMRPTELADDHSPTVPVVAHAINQMQAAGFAPELVCCIYPGCPLLDPDDLRKGLALLESGCSAYTFPVLTFPAPIQRALRRRVDGTTEPFDSKHTQTRSQDLEPAFYDAGQFYWGRASAWQGGVDIHLNCRTLIIPEWRAVDIDTPDDWSRAETLFQARQYLATHPSP